MAGTTDEELDQTSRRLLEALDRVRWLEERKRREARSTPAFHALAEEVRDAVEAATRLAQGQAEAGAEDSPIPHERATREPGDWTRHSRGASDHAGNGATAPQRMVIVEDHAAIADGLAALLSASADVVVAGVAVDQHGASELIERERPDVVLCDVMLGGTDAGFELLERHGRDARFIMYSAFDLPAHHVRAVRGGAAGYISKMEGIDAITRALSRATAGRNAFSREVLESVRTAPAPPTPRELELLEQLVDGATNDEAARALGIRPKTVEGMLRRMFDRYDVGNRLQLARMAQDQGWLTSRERQPD